MKKLLTYVLLLTGLVSAASCSKDDKKDNPAPNVMTVTGELRGANEAPTPVNSPGTGTVTGTFNTVTNEFSYNITYSGLTGPLTMGHFHIGAPGVAAPAVIFFSNLANPIKTTLVLTPEQRAALLAGNLYANLHTVMYPGGEVRANVVAK